MNKNQAEARGRAPERVWLRWHQKSSSFSGYWWTKGDVEYVRADLPQQPASERCGESTARFVTSEEAEHTSASGGGACLRCGGSIPTCCKCVFPATGATGDLISHNAAMRATCYMCAKPERYGPPKPLEGSERLFHFQGADNWNAGQCFAQPLLNIPVAATGAGDDEQRDVCWHCKVVLSGVSKPRCEDCPDECDVEGREADGCADAADPPAPAAEGEPHG